MLFLVENRTSWYVAVDADGASITGTVVMAFSIVFLVILLLLDTIVLRVQLCYMKENLQHASIL